MIKIYEDYKTGLNKPGSPTIVTRIVAGLALTLIEHEYGRHVLLLGSHETEFCYLSVRDESLSVAL